MSLIEEIKKQISLYGHYSPTSTPYLEIVASPDINQPQDDLKNWPIWPSNKDTPVERNPWDMVRCLMRDLNLNRIQACGIVGNLYAESSLENGRIQHSKPGFKGPLKIDGLTGYGLAQWTSKNRQQDLYDFARSLNQRSTQEYSMYIEYQFLIWEFTAGGYGSKISELKTKTSIYEATKLILQKFEVPQYYDKEWKIQERVTISQRIYELLDTQDSHTIEGLQLNNKNYKPPTTTGVYTPPIDEEVYKPRTWDPDKNSYEQFPETNAFGDKKAVFPEDPKTSIVVDLKYVDDEGKTVKYGQAYYTLYKETSTGKLYYTISSTGSPEGQYIPSIRDLKVYFNQ
jgi:hypothetical protein